MSQIVPFSFESIPLRTQLIDGAPWFAANDVCAALGFSNPRQAVASHVDAEDVKLLDTNTSGGVQAVKYLNESGVYALIFGSEKPAAKAFKRWVTTEVLPALRRNESAGAARVTALAEELLAARPIWRAVIRYRALGLQTGEIARLVGQGRETTRCTLRRLEALGLLPTPAQARLPLEG